MIINTLSSRDLEAVQNGPLIITDRGKPSYVLMTYDEFNRLSGQPRSLIDVLAMPDLSQIDFSPERIEITPRAMDLS
jgi:hypothetical protein